MKFNYAFSPMNQAFYPYIWKSEYDSAGTWPVDAVDVPDEVFHEFSSQPPEGMRLGSDKLNMPEWVKIPPPTPEQLQQQAEYEKRYRMSQATNAIAPLQYAVDLQMATDAEQATLIEWKRYCVLLNRVDCSTAPNIDWPKAPE
ncbi:tail fiber assembly protein [Xenorhabdus griffiniae]|uniref:tail fiber assembly protein n=1 Tax=Xenorhabdus griffiniae TaxID=351672 RepID=UPI0030CED8F2